GADGHNRFVRIEIQQSIWKMDEPLGVDDLLARRSGDVDVIVLDPLTVHPKGEGAEAASFRKIFRHPRAVGTECFGKVLHQRCKKLLARFRCGPFEDRAQGSIGFEILKRLEAIKGRGGHGRKYGMERWRIQEGT